MSEREVDEVAVIRRMITRRCKYGQMEGMDFMNNGKTELQIWSRGI